MKSTSFLKCTTRVIVASIAILLAACSAEPIALASKRINSPDAKRSAVIEELDNVLGFGLGALIYEVHVVQAADDVRTHGDASRSAIFYANITDYNGPPTTVKRMSSNQLQVTYGKALTPGKKESQLGEITIEYVLQ